MGRYKKIDKSKYKEYIKNYLLSKNASIMKLQKDLEKRGEYISRKTLGKYRKQLIKELKDTEESIIDKVAKSEVMKKVEIEKSVKESGKVMEVIEKNLVSLSDVNIDKLDDEQRDIFEKIKKVFMSSFYILKELYSKVDLLSEWQWLANVQKSRLVNQLEVESRIGVSLPETRANIDQYDKVLDKLRKTMQEMGLHPVLESGVIGTNINVSVTQQILNLEQRRLKYEEEVRSLRKNR